MADNRLIADLTAKLVDLQRQDSDLAVTFPSGLSDSPEECRADRPDPQLYRGGKRARYIRDSIQYLAAQEREQLLAGELEKQRNVVNKVNEDIIQYAIYKGDAESSAAAVRRS